MHLFFIRTTRHDLSHTKFRPSGQLTGGFKKYVLLIELDFLTEDNYPTPLNKITIRVENKKN